MAKSICICHGIFKLIDTSRRMFNYREETNLELIRLGNLFKKARTHAKHREIIDEMLKIACQIEPDLSLNGDIKLRKTVYEFCVKVVTPFYRKNVLAEAAFQPEALLNGDALLIRYCQSLLTSDPQVGKTLIINCLSAMYLAAGVIPACFQPHDSNRNQTKMRVIKFFAALNEYLLERKIKTDIFKRVGMLPRQIKLPAILLGIHHYSHVERLVQLTRDRPFALIIDEAHKIGGFKNLPKNDDYTNVHDNDVKYDCLLAILKRKAALTVYVTATPQDVLVCTNLAGENIVRLPKPPTYRDITTAEIITIPDEKRETYSVDNQSIILPPSFLPCMKQTVNCRLPQPSIVLVRLELLNVKQTSLARFFNWEKPVNNDHAEIIASNCLAITHNTNGLRMFVPKSWQSEIFAWQKRKYKYNHSQGCFIFGKTSPEYILDILTAHERQPGMIVFIAWHNCVEGISYCTSYDNPRKWRPSHMYFSENRASTPTYCSIVEQSLSRVCGNNPGEFRPIIYCSRSNKEKLLKSKNVTDTVIDACIKNPLERVHNIIGSLPIPKNRLHSKQHRVTGAKELYNIVNNPNEDIEDTVLANCSPLEYLSIAGHPFYHDEKQVERIRNEMTNEAKNKYDLPHYLALKDLVVIPKGLWDTFIHLFDSCAKNNIINTWQNASRFYRDDKRDRQNTFHLLEHLRKMSPKDIVRPALGIRCKGKHKAYEITLLDEDDR